MLEGEKKCTYFKKKIHGKWSIKGLKKKKNYCWFASDATGAMLGMLTFKNNSISLLWELNPVFM